MNNGDKTAIPIVVASNILENGLTKREYAAIKAMQGLLASDPEGDMTTQNTVSVAVHLADALLAELEKGDER